MIFSQSSSGSSICSLANLRCAWTCAGLSRGTCLALQDLSPSRYSVLFMVDFVTLVPALCRSFIRSLHVVLWFLLTVLMIILTPWDQILRGAPDRGRLWVVLYVFHFLTIVPTVDFFTPSCLPIVDFTLPSLVQVYNFLSAVLRQLFGLGHGWVWSVTVWGCGQVSDNGFKKVPIIQVTSGGQMSFLTLWCASYGYPF